MKSLRLKMLAVAGIAAVALQGAASAAVLPEAPPDGGYDIGTIAPASFSAGSPATLVTATSTALPASAAAQVCFFVAGAGPTATPLTITSPGAGTASFTVPAAYFAAIPQSSFASGTATAAVYFIAPGGTCNGTADSTFSTSTTAQIVLPTVTGISTRDLPESVPATGKAIRFVVTGTNFAPGSQVIFTDFITHSGATPANFSGVTTYLGPTALLVTAPSISSDITDASFLVTSGSDTSTTPGGHVQLYNPRGDAFTQVSLAPLVAGQNTNFTATVAYQQGQVAYAQAGTVPTGALTIGAQTGDSITVALTAANPSGITFAAATPGPVTASPLLGSALADINGDGLPDAITFSYLIGNQQIHAVQVKVSTAGFPLGEFRPAITTDVTSVCGSPQGMVTGDFNGDGLADVVIACYPGDTATEQLYLLLSKGDGTFQTPAPIAQTTGFRFVAADFFHHGRLDIGAVGYSAIEVFGNNGDGTFAAGVTTNFPGDSFFNPQTVRAADVNGDGFADLVLADNQLMGLFFGHGDGTFNTTPDASFTNTFGEIGDIAIADVTGDGLPDIVAAADPEDDGTGAGPAGVGHHSARAVRHGNFTGPTGGAMGFYTFVNSSAGIAASFAAPVFSAADVAPGLIAIGDFNGDFSQDIFAAPEEGADTAVGYAGANTGSFFAESLTFTTPIAGASAVGAIDLDGDGLTDVELVQADGQQFGAQSWLPTGAAAVAAGTNLGLQTGDTTISFSYAGNNTYIGAFTTEHVVIAPIPATLTLTPSATSVTYGQAVSLTVTVIRSLQAPGGFSGQVTFTANGQTLGTAGVNPAGTAVLNNVSLPVGTNSIVATYTGDPYDSSATATASVVVAQAPFALDAISPGQGNIGDGAKNVTLTGVGFVTGDVATVNGTAVPTVFHNSTFVVATIPASFFVTPGVLELAVANPATGATTGAEPYTVGVPPVDLQFTGPTTSKPGTDQVLDFHLVNPYPSPLNVTLTLTFDGATSPAVDDPNILFANGTRTFTFTVAADSTATPQIQISAGTTEGAITVTAQLSTVGIDVTPTDLAPVVITQAAAIPKITSATLATSGSTATITITGFSNTREVQTAHYEFFPVTGQSFTDPDINVDVTGDFTPYFTGTTSIADGSEFVYTQQFTLNGSATEINTVLVTLINTVGSSVTVPTQ